MKRLAEKTVLSGLVMDWRLAICPTITSSCSSQATTEGVVRSPSSLTITLGSLPSMIATTRVGRAEIDADDLTHVNPSLRPPSHAGDRLELL